MAVTNRTRKTDKTRRKTSKADTKKPAPKKAASSGAIRKERRNNKIAKPVKRAKKTMLEGDSTTRDRVESAIKADAGKKITLGLPGAPEAKEAIDALLGNDKGITYLKKNVSRSVADVISLLTIARTDEYIAEKLCIKINAVRRILNIMQNYGITNYYISKNKNGWLSFAWYMNTSKLPAFLEYVRGIESEKSMIEENCNDYFVCNSCYNDNKLIFTFDAAYEAGFSCNACGKNLDRLGGKNDVERLLDESAQDVKTLERPGIK